MFLKMRVFPLLYWLSSPRSEVGAAGGPGLLMPENFLENYTRFGAFWGHIPQMIHLLLAVDLL